MGVYLPRSAPIYLVGKSSYAHFAIGVGEAWAKRCEASEAGEAAWLNALLRWWRRCPSPQGRALPLGPMGSRSPSRGASPREARLVLREGLLDICTKGTVVSQPTPCKTEELSLHIVVVVVVTVLACRLVA